MIRPHNYVALTTLLLFVIAGFVLDLEPKDVCILSCIALMGHVFYAEEFKRK
jgi:hypothetical protein